MIDHWAHGVQRHMAWCRTRIACRTRTVVQGERQKRTRAAAGCCLDRLHGTCRITRMRLFWENGMDVACSSVIVGGGWAWEGPETWDPLPPSPRWTLMANLEALADHSAFLHQLAGEDGLGSQIQATRGSRGAPGRPLNWKKPALAGAHHHARRYRDSSARHRSANPRLGAVSNSGTGIRWDGDAVLLMEAHPRRFRREDCGSYEGFSCTLQYSPPRSRAPTG